MSLATDLQGDIGDVFDDPDFGEDASLYIPKTVGTAYDPATGAGTPAGFDAPIALRVIPLNYRDSVIDGTMIRRGDRKVLIKARGLNVIPPNGAKIKITSDGEELTIVESRRVRLAGTNLIFVSQARK